VNTPGGGAANDESEDGELPFVDEHAITIAASRDLVWTALQRYVVTSLRIVEGNRLAKILGAEHPPASRSQRAHRPNG